MDEGPSVEVVSAMQREFGLTAEQAKARMAFESAVPAIEKSLKAELSDRFAGAWLNAEGNKLIVGVTNDADAALVRSAGAVPQRVKYTSEQLDTVKALLDGQAQFAGSDIHAWYVDPATNSVVVEVAEASASLASTRGFVAAAGQDTDAVRVVPSKERPQPLYNIVGGNAYYIGSGRCSVGFAVTVGGFVTAGHCGRAGSATTGYNRVSQGTFRGSSFPGNDYAWVKTNTNWTSTNQVAGTSARVAGSTVAAIGSSVCRSGSTTGWRCGTVGAYNATVNYAQGSVSGLTRTSACAQPGDSGGSFISGTQAQGVTSGGSGNCSVGGTTYFQPVNEILSAYGLSLQR
ncbi:S1 family peptidase [Myxococcus sp. SDU36]|uniref:S1 family peptidase n=1 Tax=Myxococcus sp. SDU36 TaxID=2831967 RepID=UPI0025427F63|nr:S1 family peptidase [Myxococcus sp. SDU36]